MDEIKNTYNDKTESSIKEIFQDSLREKTASTGKDLDIPSFIRIALQRSSDLIFIVDADASFVFTNQTICKLLGLIERELKSLKLYDIDMLCDATIWQNKFKTLRTTSALNWETYYYTKGGDIFPIAVSLNYMVNEGKEFCLGIARDITAYRKMETSLNENRTNYRKLMESSGIGLITVDMLGIITSVDKTIRELTGYSDNELLGQHFTSIIDDEDVPGILRLIDQTIAGEGEKITEQMQYRLKNRDERVVWCNAALTDLKQYSTNVGFTVIIRDITRQKVLEETVKESQQRYLSALDAPLEQVCRFSPDGTITYTNSAFCSYYGKQSGELVGCNFLALIDERHHDLLISSIDSLLNNSSAPVYKTIDETAADGQKKLLEYSIKALFNECGQIIQFQIVLTDITERNKVVRMLKDSNEQNQLILNNMLDAVAVFEILYEGDQAIESRFIEINSAFEKFVGMPASEIIGKTVWEIFPATSIIQANLWWKSITKQKAICLDEIYFPDIDRYLRLTGFSPRKGRYAVMVMDITENKKLAEKTINSHQLYSLGEMAAGLVHEVNNPLTSAIRFSQLLLAQPDLPSNIKEDLLSIETEASRASGILKEFLNFAKRQKLKKKLANITELISRVVQLNKKNLNKSNIDVKCNLATNLPQIMIDTSQMQQVLTNIILNAEYFMYESHKKGTLQITSEKLNNWIKIICDDDGPGIAAEDLAQIFKPFFSTKEAGRGTGLGLSISYRIIKEHNGNIYAEAREGGGSRFVIELPVDET